MGICLVPPSLPSLGSPLLTPLLFLFLLRIVNSFLSFSLSLHSLSRSRAPSFPSWARMDASGRIRSDARRASATSATSASARTKLQLQIRRGRASERASERARKGRQRQAVSLSLSLYLSPSFFPASSLFLTSAPRPRVRESRRRNGDGQARRALPYTYSPYCGAVVWCGSCVETVCRPPIIL